MTQPDELLPCPLCRGEAIISVTEEDKHGNTIERTLACKKCPIIGGYAYSDEELADCIAKWNTRPTPRIDDQAVPAALEYFKPPFKYEPLSQTIYCTGANGKQMCLQVRGWVNLIGGGANGIPVEKAEHVQDEFGQWVTDALNYYIAAHYNLTRKD